MSLIPDEIADQIPELGSTSEVPFEASTVHVCFRLPESNWRWYVLEYDGHDRCRGVIFSGRFAVPGEFSLSELRALKISGGCDRVRVVERDPDFQAISLADLSQREPALREILIQAQDQLVELEP